MLVPGPTYHLGHTLEPFHSAGPFPLWLWMTWGSCIWCMRFSTILPSVASHTLLCCTRFYCSLFFIPWCWSLHPPPLHSSYKVGWLPLTANKDISLQSKLYLPPLQPSSLPCCSKLVYLEKEGLWGTPEEVWRPEGTDTHLWVIQQIMEVLERLAEPHSLGNNLV